MPRLHSRDSATVAGWALAAVLMAGVPLLVTPAPASAISGGGLDYAELNLTGKDFSNGKYKAKVLFWVVFFTLFFLRHFFGRPVLIGRPKAMPY